jgi:hypothetical protein
MREAALLVNLLPILGALDVTPLFSVKPAGFRYHFKRKNRIAARP